MNVAVKGRKPAVTPAKGDIRLQARDARVHAQSMRYEPQPNKNVLGFWTNAADWADWEFEVPVPGVYEVEVQQGCGKGSGGAEVAVEIDGQTLSFTVQGYGPLSKHDPTDDRPSGAHRRNAHAGSKAADETGCGGDGLARVVLRPISASH